MPACCAPISNLKTDIHRIENSLRRGPFHVTTSGPSRNKDFAAFQGPWVLSSEGSGQKSPIIFGLKKEKFGY